MRQDISYIKRLASGFRISFITDPALNAQAWSNLMQQLDQDPYTIIASAMLEEDFFVDDWQRNMQPSQLMYHMMQSGEIFACMFGNRLAGIGILTSIIRQREATFAAWVLPEFRRSPCIKLFFEDLRAYCFRPFRQVDDPEHLDRSGLGLRKLKANVSVSNGPAMHAAGRLGFALVGRSPLDGLYSGYLTDMLMLELPNPHFFPRIPDVRQQQSTSAPDVQPARPIRAASAGNGRVSNAAGVHVSTGPKQRNSTGSKRSRSGTTRRSIREDNAVVAPVGTEPNEQPGDARVRTKLVSAKRRPTNRTK